VTETKVHVQAIANTTNTSRSRNTPKFPARQYSNFVFSVNVRHASVWLYSLKERKYLFINTKRFGAKIFYIGEERLFVHSTLHQIYKLASYILIASRRSGCNLYCYGLSLSFAFLLPCRPAHHVRTHRRAPTAAAPTSLRTGGGICAWSWMTGTKDSPCTSSVWKT
jgi:hypothetical protein